MSRHVTSCYVTPRHGRSRHFTSRHFTSRHARSRHIIQHWSMHSNSCVCVVFLEGTKKNTYMTYHFSRAEVFGVYLDVDHSCLLATANLFLIFTFPPIKTKTLRRRNIFQQVELSTPASLILYVQFVSLMPCTDKTCQLFFSSEIDTTGILKGHTHLQLHVGVLQDKRGRWTRGETEEETEQGRSYYNISTLSSGTWFQTARQRWTSRWKRNARSEFTGSISDRDFKLFSSGTVSWTWIFGGHSSITQSYEIAKTLMEIRLCIRGHSHNGLPHMFERRHHKVPHTVYLPRGYYEILWLILLQHHPHSLKETERDRERLKHLKYTAIRMTVQRSMLDSAQFGPDRQEVNLRPLGGAFARTSVLTSLWEAHGTNTVGKEDRALPRAQYAPGTHKNAHVAVNAHAPRHSNRFTQDWHDSLKPHHTTDEKFTAKFRRWLTSGNKNTSKLWTVVPIFSYMVQAALLLLALITQWKLIVWVPYWTKHYIKQPARVSVCGSIIFTMNQSQRVRAADLWQFYAD